MEAKIKIGSWNKYSDYTHADWKESGSMIDSSVTIKDVLLCNPVHLSGGVILHSGVKIDKYTLINWNSILFPNVHIGSFCSVARNVQIGLANHPIEWLSTNAFQYNSSNFPNDSEFQKVKRKKHLHHPKTIIGSDVWIGANALIKSGVNIGHGAVIAAGATVVSNVAPYSVVGGVPAKHIKYRFSKEIIEDLLDLKWWLLSIDKLQCIEFDNIDKAIQQLKEI